ESWKVRRLCPAWLRHLLKKIEWMIWKKLWPMHLSGVNCFLNMDLKRNNVSGPPDMKSSISRRRTFKANLHALAADVQPSHENLAAHLASLNLCRLFGGELSR